jgi:hypothetical protein
LNGDMHYAKEDCLCIYDGDMDLTQMKEAFNWNVSGENAFGKIPTDAQAPWGSVFKEFMRQTPELVKAGLAVVTKKAKKDDELK